MSFWGLILDVWFQALSFLSHLTAHLGWVLLKRGAISETTPQSKTSCERTQEYLYQIMLLNRSRDIK